MHPLTDERLPNDTLMFTSCPLRSTRRVSAGTKKTAPTWNQIVFS